MHLSYFSDAQFVAKIWQSDGPEVKECTCYSLCTSLADVVDLRLKSCNLLLQKLLDCSNLGICILLNLAPLFIIACSLQLVRLQECVQIIHLCTCNSKM